MTHFNFQRLHATVDVFYKDHCARETTHGSKKERISTWGVHDCIQRSDKHCTYKEYTLELVQQHANSELAGLCLLGL